MTNYMTVMTSLFPRTEFQASDKHKKGPGLRLAPFYAVYIHGLLIFSISIQ